MVGVPHLPLLPSLPTGCVSRTEGLADKDAENAKHLLITLGPVPAAEVPADPDHEPASEPVSEPVPKMQSTSSLRGLYLLRRWLLALAMSLHLRLYLRVSPSLPLGLSLPLRLSLRLRTRIPKWSNYVVRGHGGQPSHPGEYSTSIR